MLGYLIVALICGTATVLSVPAVSFLGLASWFSLASSSTAFTAMALNQFLATRPRYLERLFGGLDRIYALHRQLGILALALIAIHYFFPPNFKGVEATDGSNVAAKVAGQIAFYFLVSLCALALVKRVPFTRWGVPYQWWRQSHRLMGVMFCFAAFHQLLIKKPPGSGDALLFDFLAVLAVLGVLSFVVAEVLPLARQRPFVVSKVERLRSATLIEARPSSGALRIRAGQFAFLGVAKAGLRERHPFTVAGQHPDGTLRFIIKPCGDYTTRLRSDIAVGDRLMIEGGYGRFTSGRGGCNQLWLAGGIGITPFLAMIEAADAAPMRRVHLVHCLKSLDDAIEVERLEARAKANASFTYSVHASEAAGRLDAARLRLITPFDLTAADLWFCGPRLLRETLLEGLKREGVRFRRVEFERFEFR